MPLQVESERIDVALSWTGDTDASDSIPTFGYSGRTRFGFDELGHETFDDGRGTLVPIPGGILALHAGRQARVSFFDPFSVDLDHLDGGGIVKAPMHGKLVAVFVQPGDRVTKGQRLAIVEAMKMEHALLAPADGEVAEVSAEAGAQVAEGARLITLASEAG